LLERLYCELGAGGSFHSNVEEEKMANKTYVNISLDVGESMLESHRITLACAFLMSQITQLVVQAKSTEIGLSK
jgi:hypothetical protein